MTKTAANFYLVNDRTIQSRRGSVMGLMAILLPALAILAAFAINLAHIQVTRTELMVATDAAARAGGRAFSETQSAEQAKQIARNVAALNLVNGEPLLVRTADSANEMEFGRSSQPDGLEGRYAFERIPIEDVNSGREFASAFRVNGRRDSGGLSGRVPFVLSGVLNQSDFSTTQDATALQVDRDISLVLDRSGSMDFVDLDFRGWPVTSSFTLSQGFNAGLLGRNPFTGQYFLINGNTFGSFQQFVYEDVYQFGEAPPTPWQELGIAVDAFLNVLESTSQEEQVSVSSYATTASLDLLLEKDFDLVRSTLNGLRPSGRTAIGEGMNEGIETLLASAARPFAAKTMVVMTDGIHNQGVDPVTVASNLVSQYNLTIHTVTFGEDADQSRMSQVAAVGGGTHYHAATGAELVEIFEEIANNLPTIITE